MAVLGYHKIGPPPPGGWETWFYITEDVFRTQLDYLDSHGWRVIGASKFLNGMQHPDTLPAKTALITFDDGYRSAGDTALRCLSDFGYPAVMFVPTHYVGRTNAFDEGNEPEEPISSWPELGELERRGVSIQSHGVSHRAFSTLDGSCIEREIVASKAELEAHLGTAVELFSFPYGDPGTPGRADAALERAGYRAAFLYGGGVSTVPPTDRYRIPRIAMGPDTNLTRELEAHRCP